MDEVNARERDRDIAGQDNASREKPIEQINQRKSIVGSRESHGSSKVAKE